jgi:hypothetical protein
MSRTPEQEAALDAAIARLESLAHCRKILKDLTRTAMKPATREVAYLTLIHSKDDSHA